MTPVSHAGANPGKDLFERRCAGCHALDHEKTGPHHVFIPDNDMAFRVANKDERAAIIEYLKEVPAK
jgi:cytochrome c2